LTGTGLAAINRELFGTHILATPIAILVTLGGVYHLISYFYGRKDCSTCNKKITSEKGKSICISCNTITTHSAKRKQNIYGSIILSIYGILGITSLLFGEITSVIQYLDWTGYLIMLAIGLYGISTNIRSAQYCTKCGEENTIIPLDDPKAQELITQNNLSVPE